MDGQVARRDAQVADLLDKFVCVRMVQCWGMDLSIFQFDSDLTWAVFFLNADKTIYGRYGSHSSKDALKEISIEGFRKSVEGALELHKGYPANKASLAGKTGAAPQWKTPEAIPNLPQTPAKHTGPADVSRWGCVHCHMVHEGEVRSRWQARQPITDAMLWKYPGPDLLGLVMDAKELATPASVTAGSAAEKAGFKAGDRIKTLEGQAILSIADIQWVLQNAKEPGSVKAQVDRSGQNQDLTLVLDAGWRRKGTFIWPGRITGWMLSMHLLGFGAGSDPQGAKVNHVDNAGAAKKAGLLKGDVITEADGVKVANESEFVAFVYQKKQPGQSLALTVLRGGNPVKVNLTLP